ncbi:MAG: Ger(x)C family spore germination protein [Bacillota bacterium]
MKKFLLLIIFFQFILTGCVEKEILDDVNLVTAVGFDRVEENRIEGTVIINTYLKDQPVQDSKLTNESELSRDILANMQKESTDPLVLGKLQIVLFGEDLSKSGISDLVDTLQRDASIGERLLLAVTRGKSKDILDADFSTKGASRFLTDIILHNTINRDLPRTNLHLFLFQYYSKGQDPYLPIIKRKDKSVEIDGLALFDNEKLVSEISNEQLLFFKVLADQYSQGSYTLEIPESKEKAGIKSIASSRKLKVVSTEPLKVEISIHIEGFINEFTGKRITPKIIEKVEKAFEKRVEKETLALIEQFKELKIDPVGIGDDIRSQTRNFNIKEWKEKMPALMADVEADVVINETGVID